MQAVTEIVAAIILLFFVAKVPSHILKEVKKETINKVSEGLPPLEGFTRKLTYRNRLRFYLWTYCM